MKSLSPLLLRTGKSLLLGAALCSVSTAAFATHLMGGEMIVKHISGNSYEVQLTYYRDANPGTVMLQTQYPYSIMAPDASGYPSVVYDSTGVLRIDSTLSTSLLANSPYAIEVGVYKDTVQLLGGTYWFRTSECCRNQAILNMTQPGTESMGLVTKFTVPGTGANHSPQFLTNPVPCFNVNMPVAYNPLPYDPDGDSLVWSLNVPLTDVAWNPTMPATLGAPVTGFSTPPADPSNPFSLNPVSGTFNWTPSTIGNFVQSFLVDEYRNGVKIGSMVRDYQYIVIGKDSNATPTMARSSNVQYNLPGQYYYLEYTPGQPLTFSVTGSVATVLTQLEMTAHSALFQGANPPQFVVSSNGTSSITGTIAWTPTSGFNQTVPVVLRAKNGHLFTDFTVVLKRSATPTSVSKTETSKIKLYPNPNNGAFKLELSGNQTHVKVDVINAAGQQVANVYEGATKDQQVLSFTETLAKGLYFVRIQSAAGKEEMISFVVQ